MYGCDSYFMATYLQCLFSLLKRLLCLFSRTLLFADLFFPSIHLLRQLAMLLLKLLEFLLGLSNRIIKMCRVINFFASKTESRPPNLQTFSAKSYRHWTHLSDLLCSLRLHFAQVFAVCFPLRLQFLHLLLQFLAAIVGLVGFRLGPSSLIFRCCNCFRQLLHTITVIA